MKTKRTLAGLILLILLIASAPRAVASNPKAFPPQTQTFVDDLLTDYNSFVGLQWRDNQTGFAIMQRFFSLYAPPDQTFRVIVAWAGPRDNASLNMMFIPIGGNTPVVVYDPTDYLANNLSPPSALNPCTQPTSSTSTSTSQTTEQGNSYQVTVTMHVCEFAQVGVNLTGNYDYATNIAFDYNGTITNPVLAIGVRVANMTGNYTAFAQTEATHLYYDDLNNGKSYLAANPTITTTTQTTQAPNQGLSLTDWVGLISGVIAILVAAGAVFRAGRKRRIKRELKDFAGSSEPSRSETLPARRK